MSGKCHGEPWRAPVRGDAGNPAGSPICRFVPWTYRGHLPAVSAIPAGSDLTGEVMRQPGDGHAAHRALGKFVSFMRKFAGAGRL
ncbi:hypothetical protein FRACA_100007 [Frankia canadensis]|uniref:Uncharacterized protein n=1 Tax=Frankia canadensis TaxID=1836972 RepID=A0A2I2KII3_9ACTN|nr:hypothetical protein FRACA_100007 [Frankia canadensis]SOU52729.1 hypothetical protein FRACA_100007 [Frankia canadensis]